MAHVSYYTNEGHNYDPPFSTSNEREDVESDSSSCFDKMDFLDYCARGSLQRCQKVQQVQNINNILFIELLVENAEDSTTDTSDIAFYLTNSQICTETKKILVDRLQKTDDSQVKKICIEILTKLSLVCDMMKHALAQDMNAITAIKDCSSEDPICRLAAEECLKSLKKSSTKHVVKAPLSEKATKMRKKYDDDVAFWGNTESFMKTNRAKMEEGDADRDKLLDAIYCLDSYSETDNKSGMTRDQLRKEAQARAEKLSASFGSLRTFRHTNRTTNNHSSPGIYGSRTEALEELKSIVSTLIIFLNENSSPEVLLQKELLHRLDCILRKEDENESFSLLGMFLQLNPMMNGRSQEILILSKPLCQWMFNCSHCRYDVMGHISTTCRQNLVRMIVNELDIYEGATFSADLSFIKQLSIADLVSYLGNECGLWLNPGPNLCGNDHHIDDNAGNLDMYAIKNIFILWKAALDRDLIKLDTDNGDPELFQEATKAATALTLVGIDPTFSLAGGNLNNCLSAVPILLQNLLAALIKSSIRQISNKHNESVAKKWIERTADHMVTALSKLKAGEEGTADYDDEGACLFLACTAERMVDFEDGELSFGVIEMKLNFITLALKHCLAKDGVYDIENERLKGLVFRDGNNDATKERILRTATHALVHAEYSLQHIEKNYTIIKKAKLHASVQLSVDCTLVGLHLYKEIECKLQFGVFKECISNIQTACSSIGAKCDAYNTHSCLAKECLLRLRKVIESMEPSSAPPMSSAPLIFPKPSVSAPTISSAPSSLEKEASSRNDKDKNKLSSSKKEAKEKYISKIFVETFKSCEENITVDMIESKLSVPKQRAYELFEVLDALNIPMSERPKSTNWKEIAKSCDVVRRRDFTARIHNATGKKGAITKATTALIQLLLKQRSEKMSMTEAINSILAASTTESENSYKSVILKERDITQAAYYLFGFGIITIEGTLKKSKMLKLNGITSAESPRISNEATSP